VLVYTETRGFEAAAAAPDASAETRTQWTRYEAALLPPHPPAETQVAIYRGDWRTVARARAADATHVETRVMPWMLPETLGLMLLGMALFRAGFFSGNWPRRHYWTIALAGAGVTIPLYAALAAWRSATQFDPILLLLTDPLHLTLLRPALTVAAAALVILFVTSGRARWLATRLTATGRMAFSNYLGTSIVCTLIFYGYGLGWFGRLDRWQLYPLVFAIWLAMLGWSQPWLARFAYGPAEWLWRSMARGRWQRLRRA